MWIQKGVAFLFIPHLHVVECATHTLDTVLLSRAPLFTGCKAQGYAVRVYDVLGCAGDGGLHSGAGGRGRLSKGVQVLSFSLPAPPLVIHQVSCGFLNGGPFSLVSGSIPKHQNPEHTLETVAKAKGVTDDVCSRDAVWGVL